MTHRSACRIAPEASTPGNVAGIAPSTSKSSGWPCRAPACPASPASPAGPGRTSRIGRARRGISWRAGAAGAPTTGATCHGTSAGGKSERKRMKEDKNRRRAPINSGWCAPKYATRVNVSVYAPRIPGMLRKRGRWGIRRASVRGRGRGRYSRQFPERVSNKILKEMWNFSKVLRTRKRQGKIKLQNDLQVQLLRVVISTVTTTRYRPGENIKLISYQGMDWNRIKWGNNSSCPGAAQSSDISVGGKMPRFNVRTVGAEPLYASCITTRYRIIIAFKYSKD